MKQLINIKFSFVLKNLFIALCFLLLWSCGHKSTKFDDSGLFILAEDTIFGGISYEDRIRPVFEGYGSDEARGMVPDKETAIKIAESIWYPIYGSHIYTELPFEADLEGDSVWTVHGNFPHGEGWVGGCAKIRIRKKDASITYVIHEL